MKKIKSSLFILTCMAVIVSMTACLGNDDENDIPYENLTPAEKKTAIQAIKGTYSGKVFFYNPYATTTAEIDSTEVSWTVTETDSLFQTNNIPVSIFANYVDDMNHKNILQAGGNVKFQTTVHPNNIERTSDKVYYLFSLKDDNSLATTIQHEGVPHSVTVNFANIIYFYDSHNVSRAYFPYADYWLNKFMLRLYVSSIVIDGFTYDIINSQKIKTFTFSGTK